MFVESNNYSNPKVAAWDRVGRLFWEAGRPSARPGPAAIDALLTNVREGTNCAILGASTRDLVIAAISREARVSVFDFSQKMCDDLAASLNRSPERIVLLDITRPLPEELKASQQIVLSDRLVNRFSFHETRAALSNMLGMVRPGGEVRATIKLGFYAMDLLMLQTAQQCNADVSFFDLATRTINYAAAGPLLEKCLLPHGNIPTDTLLAWYRDRGCESRYEHADVMECAESARFDGAQFDEIRFVPCPDANDVVLYQCLLN